MSADQSHELFLDATDWAESDEFWDERLTDRAASMTTPVRLLQCLHFFGSFSPSTPIPFSVAKMVPLRKAVVLTSSPSADSTTTDGRSRSRTRAKGGSSACQVSRAHSGISHSCSCAFLFPYRALATKGLKWSRAKGSYGGVLSS